MKEIAPLIFLVCSIWAGGAAGEFLSKKTGKKLIGWPVGILVFLVLFTVSSHVMAAQRDHRARAAFLKAEPCPVTGKARGACPGYVVDHIIPLACGGLDHPSNMQWQTAADAKEKDRWERRGCK